MTRSLRTVHRRVFVVVAIGVPALIVTALTNRAPRPGVGAVDLDSPAAGSHSRIVVSESAELWRSVEIGTQVLELDRGGYEIELSAGEISGPPDLLLYWSSEASPVRLSESSRLLGPYSGGTRRFAMPIGTDPRAGMLILYSLAHKSVFATAEVPNDGR